MTTGGRGGRGDQDRAGGSHLIDECDYRGGGGGGGGCCPAFGQFNQWVAGQVLSAFCLFDQWRGGGGGAVHFWPIQPVGGGGGGHVPSNTLTFIRSQGGHQTVPKGVLIRHHFGEWTSKFSPLCWFCESAHKFDFVNFNMHNYIWTLFLTMHPSAL